MATPPPSRPTSNPNTEESPTLEIFPPEEESQLLSESNEQKALANKTFTSAFYSPAIQLYEKALSLCPSYLEYDIAVLRSNIAACHIKLEEWKAAVDSATQALEALDRVDPPPKPATTGEKDGSEGKGGAGKAGVTEAEEIDDATEIRIAALTRTGHTTNDIHKLRTKALLRRAKANRSLGGWAALQSAMDDYTALSKPPHQLTSLDRKAVQAALRELPAELNTAKDKEMGEMMGKLKQLGNSVLGTFGLSTDNFQFVKDEKSGGYSMNFNQGGK